MHAREPLAWALECAFDNASPVQVSTYIRSCSVGSELSRLLSCRGAAAHAGGELAAAHEQGVGSCVSELTGEEISLVGV